MRVRVTKEYLWAPDGNHVRTVQVGEELEGEGAEIALQMKSAEVLEEPPAADSDEPPPAATEQAPELASEKPGKKKGR